MQYNMFEKIYCMKRFALLVLIFFCKTLSAQNTGIGTVTPQTKLHVFSGASGATPFTFSPLAVESNGHTYINLLSPAANETAILFGQPANSAHGVLMYNNTTTPNGFQFRTNGNSTRMVLTNFGALGIGTTNPQSLLDVNGTVKTNSLNIVTGGNQYDFLMRSTVSGDVGFRKGHGALGVNYIICLDGIFPPNSGPRPQYNDAIIGEIRIFSGNYAPVGWAFCSGQLLQISQYPNLFALIGTTYNGDGVNNFGVPDLRGAAPVAVGTSPAGYTWGLGEKVN
jgi:microcystin-dependent protein